MRLRLVARCLAFMLLAGSAAARQDASILADELMYVDASGAFSAVGNVEVYYDGKVLFTERLDYVDGTLSVPGPMTFSDEDGMVGIAEFGEIDQDFQRGILEGVQMLVADRIRLTGSRMRFVDGRIRQIDNAIVTTCQVCKQGQMPVWHFRSRYAVHDLTERQIYLRDVEFVLGETSLVRLPALRLPDPTVKRMSGFLVPDVGYSSGRGIQTRIPYFLTLGDHADLTLTPGATSKGKLLLGFELRRLFERGGFSTEGMLVRDRKHVKDLRAHLKVAGDFDIGNGFQLAFSAEDVTDPTVLSDFDISSESSIVSSVGLSRRTSVSYFAAESRYIERFNDGDRKLPKLVHEASWLGRYSPGSMAGSFGLSLGVLAFERHAVIGLFARDVTRGSVDLDWQNSWLLENGAFLSATALASFDSYEIRQERGNAVGRSVSRESQTVAVEIRWPFKRIGGAGQQVIEPFAQLVWSPVRDETAVPNEDSRFVEFDASNLLSLDRIAGRDRNEQGTRLNLGVKHTGTLASGAAVELLFGRVFRKRDLEQFTASPGLAGKRSDFVAAGMIDFGNGLAIDQTLVFDSDLEIAKGESFVRYADDLTRVHAGYARLLKDTEEGMTNDIESVMIAAERDLEDRWSILGDVKYDLNKDGKNSTGVGLVYRHQCLLVSLSAERQMRTSATPEPRNKFNLSLSLLGLSDQSNNASESCGA